jgi:ribosomal protein S18 acetylase RimI-like enzyme
MTIRIRPFHPSDPPACAGVFARSWAHAFAHIPRAIDSAAFQSETKGEEIFIAEQEGALIGFASFYRPHNFLHHLYVDPHFHGRGAGRALAAAIRAAASDRITLKCALSNAAALAFYARLGFTEGDGGADQNGPWVALTAPD